MANELNLSGSINLVKNGATTLASANGQFTVTGNASIKSTVSVGTSDETIDLGDVATVGYVYLKNLDATNYITFGNDGSTYILKLKAGEFAIFRYNAAALHAKANTGACLLEYCIIED